MKTLEEQNKELIEFDKTFNPNDFESCLKRAILLLKNREAQTVEEGHTWPFDNRECERRLRRAIILRKHDETMMAAAIEYVEYVERTIERFKG
jgi:hypothetical protein